MNGNVALACGTGIIARNVDIDVGNFIAVNTPVAIDAADATITGESLTHIAPDSDV